MRSFITIQGCCNTRKSTVKSRETIELYIYPYPLDDGYYPFPFLHSLRCMVIRESLAKL